MTTAADDAAVEDAFEAYLAGRPVPDGAADTFAGVAVFSEAVRATATTPGRPNAALAELLVTGLLTDQSSPSARTARSAGSPPLRRPARVRIRRRTAMFFPALVAKILSAGAVAQACTGAGVALVAFTGAGAAGVLPDPVQSTFTSVVDGETTKEAPVQEPTGAPADETPVEEAPVQEPVAAPVGVDAPVALTHDTWAGQGPAADQSFGDWVSYGSEHGWADGATVSCWAHHRNDERKGREVTECGTVAAPEGTDDSTEAGDGSEVEAPEVEAPEVETPEDAETAQRTEDSGRSGGSSHGHGHGHGNGNGNGYNSGGERGGDSGKGNGRD
ncbi:MAG: hypothetical protein JWQ99_1218 [Blastococcus sp.]|nr:hypothetical protein [Blastococcus sp.]